MDRPYKIVDSIGRFWKERMTKALAQKDVDAMNRHWQDMGSSVRAMFYYAPDRGTL